MGQIQTRIVQEPYFSDICNGKKKKECRVMDHTWNKDLVGQTVCLAPTKEHLDYYNKKTSGLDVQPPDNRPVNYCFVRVLKCKMYSADTMPNAYKQMLLGESIETITPGITDINIAVKALMALYEVAEDAPSMPLIVFEFCLLNKA